MQTLTIKELAIKQKFVLFYFYFSFITALHGMQTRSSDENSVRLCVCLSVCPSVKRVHCDKTEIRSVQIFYTTREII